MLSISLDYIGSVNVVHRDIKPANILISSIGDKKVFKLTDFGISYNDYESKWTTLNQSKTLFYASLEQMDDQEAHPSFDVWALGITIYQLMAGKLPYVAKITKIVEEIILKQRDPLPSTYSKELIDLVNKLLELKQQDRI